MDTALFEGTLVESERILYTPSTFARTNLIHLQECGRLKALSPHTSHRENLASVRKGEFEGMAEKIKLPEWQPDFPAGCCSGCRCAAA